MNTKTACSLARELEGVSEKDHFGSDAFYANKRIFATVWHERGEVNLRLSLEQQRYFVDKHREGFFQIENAWGKQGWTTADLKSVEKSLFLKALKAAWETSFKKKSPIAKTRVIKNKPKKKSKKKQKEV